MTSHLVTTAEAACAAYRAGAGYAEAHTAHLAAYCHFTGLRAPMVEWLAELEWSATGIKPPDFEQLAKAKTTKGP